MTDRFTFTRDGDQLVGTLHLPVDRPLAAVVTTGPLTSVKEQATGAYARALAERGFAALAFDHRTFGESEGQPRQLEQPEGKAADVSAAVTALGSDDRTRGLPVLAVGICAGGGTWPAPWPTIRERAFAGVAGYYSDAAALAASSSQAYHAAIDRGRTAERRWQETGEAETIPAVGPDGGDVAMPLHEAYEFYGTSRGGGQLHQRLRRPVLRVHDLVRTQEAAARLRVPFLLIHSERALAPPLARKFYAAVGAPKWELGCSRRGRSTSTTIPA